MAVKPRRSRIGPSPSMPELREVPILDPIDEADDLPEDVIAAACLDEGLALPLGGEEELTPEALLLGSDPEDRWATREDEGDRGLERRSRSG